VIIIRKILLKIAHEKRRSMKNHGIIKLKEMEDVAREILSPNL
jgi:hypothetical protein